MKNLRLVILPCVMLMSFMALAQENSDPKATGKNDTLRVAATLVDGEMIPWLPLHEVTITGKRIFRSPEEQAKFNRLRYNVLKVLPYARFAHDRYERLQNDLLHVRNRKEQRMLVKAFDKEIKEMFNREIKNLTITQGGILIKLIDRETGNSSYEWVRELKGGITAFCYQSVAKVFGNNLKNKYDPKEERDIESIIRTSASYMYN